MLVDTQPATYQHVPASPEVRDHWVNSQLIGVLMDNMGPSLLAAVLSLPVLVYLMAGQTHPIALAVWAGLVLVLLIYRYRLIGIYRLRHDSLEGPQRMVFVERYRWSWTVMALLWGGPVILSYQQASQTTQFVCGLVVLGQGLLTLTSFSAYLPVFRHYANAWIFSVFVGLAWNTVRLLDKPEAVQTGLVLMALLFVFWGLLLMAGRRLHEVHRSSFELQFSNQELIDSLTLHQEPFPGLGRARSAPAGARAEPLCRLAGHRARDGARHRAAHPAVHACDQRIVRFIVRPDADRRGQLQGAVAAR